MGLKFLKINPADNVAVAIDPLKKGDCITVDGKDIFLQEDIPAGHKVALKDLPKTRILLNTDMLSVMLVVPLLKEPGSMKGISKRIWRGCWNIHILPIWQN